MTGTCPASRAGRGPRGSSTTWVELTVSGLPVGETYAVWLEEAGTGERSPLGTFTGVAGELYISLYSTLPRDRADRSA